MSTIRHDYKGLRRALLQWRQRGMTTLLGRLAADSHGLLFVANGRHAQQARETVGHAGLVVKRMSDNIAGFDFTGPFFVDNTVVMALMQEVDGLRDERTVLAHQVKATRVSLDSLRAEHKLSERKRRQLDLEISRLTSWFTDNPTYIGDGSVVDNAVRLLESLKEAAQLVKPTEG